MRFWLIFICLCLFTLGACRDVPIVGNDGSGADELKEQLINANRYMNQTETTQIEAYISRRGWHMTALAGGIWMETVREGGGAPLRADDTVHITYSVEDLFGTVIYAMKEEDVVVGHLKPVRGVDAALRTMCRGAEARVIVPSSQAYGVVGDGDRIGGRMTLVYKINNIQ